MKPSRMLLLLLVLLFTVGNTWGTGVSQEQKVNLEHCTFQSLSYPYIIITSFENDRIELYVQNVLTCILETIPSNREMKQNPSGDGNFLVWSEEVLQKSKK